LEEEINNYNFSKKQSMKLKKIMGYGEHRIAEKDTYVLDLCIFGLILTRSKYLGSLDFRNHYILLIFKKYKSFKK